jgi:predicted secreted protein
MNTKERVQAVFKAYLQREATPQEITYWVGRPNTELDDSAASSRFAMDAQKIADLQGGYVPVSEKLYRKV